MRTMKKEPLTEKSPSWSADTVTARIRMRATTPTGDAARQRRQHADHCPP